MDTNLLYFTGEYLNGVDGCLIKEGHTGRLLTHVHFIGENHMVQWSDELRSRESPLLRYAIAKMLKPQSEPMASPVEHIVTVEHTIWYKGPANDKNTVRKENYANEKYVITIYKKPKDGIKSLFTDPERFENLNLTNNLLLKLALSKNVLEKHDYEEIDKKQHNLISMFKPFFETHFQAELYKAPERSFTGRIDEGKLSFATFTMAGRVIITLEDTETHDQISFVGEDIEKGDTRMGIKSIGATIRIADTMVKKFIEHFAPLFEKGHTFRELITPGAVIYAGILFGEPQDEEKIAQ